VIDKIDKVDADTVVAMLGDEVGLSPEQARTCVALTEVTADGDELARVLTGAATLRSDRISVVGVLRIPRGLDYYTGTVYETRMQGFEHVGSICSGGRYDALASDGRTTYPGVGISLGVTRAVGPLLSRGLLTASRSTPTCVLVALPDEESRASLEVVVATALRSRGIATEVSPTAAKYGKQIRYAERRGIPYVWFPQDEGHQVRDIRSGDQVDADPQVWAPPAEDLRPSVTGPADL
jgi:histidyl-tRNA synthetase